MRLSALSFQALWLLGIIEIKAIKKKKSKRKKKGRETHGF